MQKMVISSFQDHVTCYKEKLDLPAPPWGVCWMVFFCVSHEKDREWVALRMPCFTWVCWESHSMKNSCPTPTNAHPLSVSTVSRWSLHIWVGAQLSLKPGMPLSWRLLISASLPVKANWATMWLSRGQRIRNCRGEKNSSKRLHPNLLLLVLINKCSNKMTPDVIFLYAHTQCNSRLNHHQKGFLL